MKVASSRYKAWNIKRPRAPLDLLKSVSLAVIVFMTTLASTEHVYLIVTPLLALSWLILSRVTSSRPIYSLRLVRPVVLILVVIGSIKTAKTISAILIGDTYLDIITDVTFFNRWGGAMLWLALFSSMALIFSNTSRSVLGRAIRIAFSVHVIGFLLQFSVYYVLGFVLDFSHWLGGISARTASHVMFRATGFSVEPSTFAGIIILLFASEALVTRRVSPRITLIVESLCILSYSTAAWFFSAFLIFILLPVVIKRKSVSVTVVSIAIVISIVALGSGFVAGQVAKYNRSAGIRGSLITYTLTERPMWHNIFGGPTNSAGLGLVRAASTYGGDKRKTASLSDGGTAAYLLIMYGFVGLVFYMLFLVLAYKKLSLSVFLLLFLATITKLTPATMLFTVLASAFFIDAFSSSEQRRSVEKSGGALLFQSS